MPYKLVILDRDGVINFDSDNYIKSLDEFKFIPNSIEAICTLSKNGYKVAIATNQSGIFRNYFTLDTLNEMHKKLLESVSQHGGHIDKILFCPHGPNENCSCRKPKPGMLTKLIEQFNVSPKNTIMVGDSLKDLQAAESICIDKTLVKTGKGPRTIKAIKNNPNVLKKPYYLFDNLHHFVQNIELI